MRTDDIAFIAQNTAPFSSPRYVVELSFTFDNSIKYYLTSHPDTPTPSSLNTVQGIVEKISGTSQKLDVANFRATIGALTIDLVDIDSAITDLLRAQDVAGRSLTKKRIRVYVGFEGAAISKYALIQTQIIQNIEVHDGGYKISAQDVQRETRTQIFETRETPLAANITLGATTISVESTAGFEMVAHGPAWGDAPSATVGYIYIEDNDDWAIARYTGKTSTSFTGVSWTSTATGGALFGSRPRQFLIVDGDRANEISVRELVYLELPAVKMAYALLTGTLYGQPGAVLPAHWHCGIDPQYISTSHFVNIGADLWVTADDARGPELRFIGVQGEDGRNFIQHEVLPAINCFMPVLSTGELALNRLQPVLSSSATIARLDADNVSSAGALKYANDEIANKYRVDWTWDFREERFRRSDLLYDNPSIDKHGASAPKILELKGLHGSVHSVDFLRSMFDGYRDRYAGPPITLSVDLLPKMNTLEVGDVVHVDLSHLPDYTGENHLSRAMEVQQVKIDWLSGRVTVDLFGSSAKAAPLTDYGDIAVGAGHAIADSWYSKNGVNIETAFAGSVSRSGSTVTLTADITLTGGDILAIFGVLAADAVFYVLGDFEIPSGRTLRIAKNVCLKIRGFFTIDGIVDGVGRGPAGEDSRRWHRNLSGGDYWTDFEIDQPDVARFVWFPESMANDTYPCPPRGLVHSALDGQIGAAVIAWVNSTEAYEGHGGNAVWVLDVLRTENYAPVGYNNSAPMLVLQQDETDPNSNAYLNGLPLVVAGGGGRAGGSWYRDLSWDDPAHGNMIAEAVARGCNGGPGGAGFVVFSRGADFGASGQVRLSGGNSATNAEIVTDPDDFVNTAPFFMSPISFAGGAGGAGGPGCVYFFVDGSESLRPIISDQTIEAFYGQRQYPGVPAINTFWGGANVSTHEREWDGRTVAVKSVAAQMTTQNQWAAHARVQVLTAPIAPVDDTPVEADPVLSIDLQEHTNTPVTPTGDTSSIDVAVTPPSDPNYSYSWVEFRPLGAGAWARVAAPAQPETTFSVRSDGATYQVRALAVSKSGLIAANGPIVQITVTDFADNPAAVRAGGAIFDLRVAGQTVGSNAFNTRDLAILWSYRSALGIDFVLDDWFDHFRVVIRSGSTTLATYEAAAAHFTLPVEQNAKINGGAPFDTITVEVRQVTVDGVLGGAATVTFTNTDPDAPTSVTTSPSDYGTVIRWVNPDVADLLKVELHISEISGFTPTNATLYFSGLTTSYTAAGLHPNRTHYGKIRVVDVYGNVSAYVSFTFATADVDPDLKNENQNWSDINDDNGQMPAPNADVTADSPAHQALESTVADLEQQIASLGGTGFNLALPAYGNFEGSPALTITNGTAVATNEAFRFQAKSLKVTPSAANCTVYLGTSATDYNTPFSPNSKWIISTYVMAPVGTSVAVQMHLRAADGTLYTINGTTSGTAGVWTRIYGLADLSANASDTSILRLDNDGGSGVVVYFDALQLERYVGSDTNPPPSAYKDPIENVTNSAAFQTLSQTVQNQGSTITVHTSQLSGISSTLTTKADQAWVNSQIAAAQPDALSDISPTEAAKLAGISAGADVTADSAAHQSLAGTVTSQGGTITTHSTQLTTLSDALVVSRQATANILPNGLLTSEASDGRPASVFAAYANATPANISFLDATNKSGLRLHHASVITIGAALSAIPVVGGVKMVIRIRVKASAASSNGFYFRMHEYDGTSLPAGGKFIVSDPAQSEAGAVQATREIQSLRENAAITTGWVTHVLVYTPTSTAKWASPVFIRWTGMGLAELHVDHCLVIPDAITLASSLAQQLLDQRVTAAEGGVTSVSQSVTNLSNSIPALVSVGVETQSLSLYSGVELPAQNAPRRIAFRVDNNTADLHAWYKLLEFTIPTAYVNASISGRLRYGASVRYESSQDVHARLTTGSPINTPSVAFAVNNSAGSTNLRIFRVDNGTTNQKFVVYAYFSGPWAGIEATLDVLLTNSGTANVAVWQQGQLVSISNAGYVPAGIAVTPIFNRGVADNADITASSAAHQALTSRVSTAEGAITAQATAVTTLTSRVGTAESEIEVNSAAIDGVKAHHTIMAKAASDGGVAIAGMSLLASVAGSAPQSKVRFEADQFEILRSAGQAGSKFNFVYDSTLGMVTVPAASIGNLQVANASIQGGKMADLTLTNSKFVNGTLTGVKISDGTLGRVKLESGSLGSIFHVSNNQADASAWTNLVTMLPGNGKQLAHLDLTGLQGGPKQYLLIDYSFRYHLYDNIFGLNVASWTYNAADGPSFGFRVVIDYINGQQFSIIPIARHSGHFLQYIDGYQVRGSFFTQNVLPNNVPVLEGRVVIPYTSALDTSINLTVQQVQAAGVNFRVNNINFTVSVINLP